MRKIRLPQGRARACECDRFHVLVTFDVAPGTLQSSGSACRVQDEVASPKMIQNGQSDLRCIDDGPGGSSVAQDDPVSSRIVQDGPGSSRIIQRSSG